jgi:DNA-binding response OmpR family regulator
MTGALAGRRILIVEDEYLIAADLRRTLGRAGATIVGPIGDLDEGLALAEAPLDAAVLDVNLENALAYPIADRLVARGVPYMFLTGYDAWSLPDAYRDAPCLPKPFTPVGLVAAVAGLLPTR